MSHFSDVELQQEYYTGIHDDIVEHDDFQGLKFELELLQFSIKKLLKSIETGEKRDEVFDDIAVIRDILEFSDKQMKALVFLSDNPSVLIK